MYVVAAVAVNLVVLYSPSPRLSILNVVVDISAPPEDVPICNEISPPNVLVRTMYSLLITVLTSCVTSAAFNRTAPSPLALVWNGLPDTVSQSLRLEHLIRVYSSTVIGSNLVSRPG